MNSQIAWILCWDGCQQKTLSWETFHLYLLAIQLTYGLDLLKVHLSSGQVSLRKFRQEFYNKVQLLRKFLHDLLSFLPSKNWWFLSLELFLDLHHQLGCLQQHYLEIELYFLWKNKGFWCRHLFYPCLFLELKLHN